MVGMWNTQGKLPPFNAGKARPLVDRTLPVYKGLQPHLAQGEGQRPLLCQSEPAFDVTSSPEPEEPQSVHMESELLGNNRSLQPTPLSQIWILGGY